MGFEVEVPTHQGSVQGPVTGETAPSVFIIGPASDPVEPASIFDDVPESINVGVPVSSLDDVPESVDDGVPESAVGGTPEAAPGGKPASMVGGVPAAGEAAAPASTLTLAPLSAG